MSEITIHDSDPWYLRQRPGTESRYLQVWCGNAYLLVRKEDGYTYIGYRDEGDCRPTATSNEIADWLKLFWWRASQVFPWQEIPTCTNCGASLELCEGGCYDLRESK